MARIRTSFSFARSPTHGLTDKDVELVLLQHADGKAALVRGDVDAWAGLDPLMASAELQEGATLFYRRPELNSWGILNVREAFAKENPQIVEKVLAAYEKARKHSIANPAELTAALVKVAKLPEDVIARQIERTDISYSTIGDAQKETIVAGRPRASEGRRYRGHRSTSRRRPTS